MAGTRDIRTTSRIIKRRTLPRTRHLPQKGCHLERELDEGLAKWATKYREADRDRTDDDQETYRTRFRRDRDRILYTTGFRRLQHKTQVFTTSTGDHYRTRLTHTLEVEQLATSLAQALRLNRDLCSAIALGHDLGHTPFGHAGEAALNRLAKDIGGFSHSVQSVRYVEDIAQYRGHAGLNLCRQVREGILKHDGDAFTSEGRYERQWDCSHLRPGIPGTLEMQVVYWSDKIAYVSHDWEDFKRSGLREEAVREGIITPGELEDIWASLVGNLDSRPSNNTDEIRDLIRSLHSRLLADSGRNLREFRPDSAEDARVITQQRVSRPEDYKAAFLINFESGYRTRFESLRGFLRRRYLQSPVIARLDDKAERIVEGIFTRYADHPELLPWKTQRIMREKENDPRVLVDHIAGMTDRYATDIYNQLYLPERGY